MTNSEAVAYFEVFGEIFTPVTRSKYRQTTIYQRCPNLVPMNVCEQKFRTVQYLHVAPPSVYSNKLRRTVAQYGGVSLFNNNNIYLFTAIGFLHRKCSYGEKGTHFVSNRIA